MLLQLFITFLKLKRKYTEDILGIKEAKCFLPKQISVGFVFQFLVVFFRRSVLHVSSTVQLSWKGLLSIDTSQNFQWLKFLFLMFYHLKLQFQKLALEHTRAGTSNIKKKLLPYYNASSFQSGSLCRVELSQILKTVILQGDQGLYIPCAEVLSCHLLHILVADDRVSCLCKI